MQKGAAQRAYRDKLLLRKRSGSGCCDNEFPEQGFEEEEEDLQPAKWRATGDLVFTTDCMNSGLGDDATSREQNLAIEEQYEPRRRHERHVSNLRAQELYRDRIQQPEYLENNRLVINEALAQRPPNVSLSPEHQTIQSFIHHHHANEAADCRPMAMQMVQQQLPLPRRRMAMMQQQQRSGQLSSSITQLDWYRDTGDLRDMSQLQNDDRRAMAQMLCNGSPQQLHYESRPTNLTEDDPPRHIPTRLDLGKWHQDPGTSSLEANTEREPIYPPESEKVQVQEQGARRRAISVRQMQRHIIIARQEASKPETNRRTVSMQVQQQMPQHSQYREETQNTPNKQSGQWQPSLTDSGNRMSHPGVGQLHDWRCAEKEANSHAANLKDLSTSSTDYVIPSVCPPTTVREAETVCNTPHQVCLKIFTSSVMPVPLSWNG